jgi:hypothetical protein
MFGLVTASQIASASSILLKKSEDQARYKTS